MKNGNLVINGGMDLEIDWNALQSAAISARARSYAPFSRFRVGAAVVTSSGVIYSGANYESISYGLSLCAERAALVSAQQAGAIESLIAIAVAADRIGADGSIVCLPDPVSPCGACRQWIVEAARRGSGEWVVRCGNSDFSEFHDHASAVLLPSAFTDLGLE